MVHIDVNSPWGCWLDSKEVVFYCRSAIAYDKVDLLQIPRQGSCSELTNDTFVLLICHVKEPPSSSVDRSNSEICTICRAWLITTLPGNDRERWLYIENVPSLLTFSYWFTSIACAFSSRSSLLQILRNSSCRHSVLISFSLSSVTKLSLAFVQHACCHAGVSR